jgi:hypothetical protein
MILNGSFHLWTVSTSHVALGLWLMLHCGGAQKKFPPLRLRDAPSSSFNLSENCDLLKSRVAQPEI